MTRNLFLEQLNSRGERSAPLIKRACHSIITFTLTQRQLISQLFPLLLIFRLFHSRRPPIPPALFRWADFICLTLGDVLEHAQSVNLAKLWGRERSCLYLQHGLKMCLVMCFFLNCSFTSAEKKRAGPNPGPPRSSSTIAFVSLKLVSLFSGGLSLIRTGSRVIDVSAEVRTTASITVGISSFVTRWRHRVLIVCRFTASRSYGWGETGAPVWNIHIYSWLHSHDGVHILMK